MHFKTLSIIFNCQLNTHSRTLLSSSIIDKTKTSLYDKKKVDECTDTSRSIIFIIKVRAPLNLTNR